MGFGFDSCGSGHRGVRLDFRSLKQVESCHVRVRYALESCCDSSLAGLYFWGGIWKTYCYFLLPMQAAILKQGQHTCYYWLYGKYQYAALNPKPQTKYASGLFLSSCRDFSATAVHF